MSESMGPMLREEAFHLATGVTPLRRWVEEAAADEGMVSMKMIQEVLNKWIPRGCDMFGDERGGGRNVKFGFKHTANGESMRQYLEELQGIVDDFNARYVRVRMPELSRQEAQATVKRIVEEGEVVNGIDRDTLLHVPDEKFFRRRGMHALMSYDIHGNELPWGREAKNYMREALPDSYTIGRDFGSYEDLMDKIDSGEMEMMDAVRQMPSLSRVAGTCPCSNAVRWVNGNGSE